MNAQSKQIKSVKENAVKLDRVIQTVKNQVGHFITYNGTEYYTAPTFDAAVVLGDNTFGENSGFVVRKIGAVPSLSHLVKE